MRSCFRVFCGVPLLIALAVAGGAKADPPEGGATSDELAPPVPVARVDLQRYVGLWHEIARIPNRFQKQCARDVTARYEIQDDGKVRVINTCLEADGKASEVVGVAKIVDAQSNARLKVSFVSFLGFRPFWGDYWVLGLGDGYEYAVVGTPDRKYGWILAREPNPGAEVLDEAWQVLRAQGYDIERFELSTPAAGAEPAVD